MIRVRKSGDRGHANHGWLDSFHTFSFADYQDVDHMGFRALRVINEDVVAPGRGFATHSHRDMEIVTYVLEGELEHRDSMGTGSVIRPGDLQLMRAGTGVTHSEFNHSRDSVVHLLQIWILPDRVGLAPAYEQRHFPLEQRHNRWKVVAARHGAGHAGDDGGEEALHLHQDASILATVLDPEHSVTHELEDGRDAWVQMVRGRALVNGVPLSQGDGAAVSGEDRVSITAVTAAEILLFDLA